MKCINWAINRHETAFCHNTYKYLCPQHYSIVILNEDKQNEDRSSHGSVQYTDPHQGLYRCIRLKKKKKKKRFLKKSKK
jgi:hypothetical protein